MNIEKTIYQLRNWKAHARAAFLGSYVTVEDSIAKFIGATETAGMNRMYGRVDAVVHRANGKKVDLGCLGKRIVTTAFINYLRDDLAAGFGSADISTFLYHECGTGVVAENASDTALGTPCTTVLNPDSTRATGTQDRSVSLTYSSVGTLTFDGSAAVTEHGLFSAATTGTLMDRTVFAAVNVGSGDSIQFTYTLTMSGS